MTPSTGRVLNSGFDAWLFRRAYAEATQAALDKRNWWLTQIANNLIGGALGGALWFPWVLTLVLDLDSSDATYWPTLIAAGIYMSVLSFGESWFVLVASITFSVRELCRARMRWLLEARPTRQQARTMYYEMDYTFDLVTKYCARTTMAVVLGTTVDLMLVSWYLAFVELDIIPVIWFVACGCMLMGSLGALVVINVEAFHFTSDFLLVFDSLPAECAGTEAKLDLENHPAWLGIPARLKLEARLGCRLSSDAAFLGTCDDHHGFLAYVAQRPLGLRLMGALMTASLYSRVCYIVLAISSIVLRAALMRDVQ